jgi:hypothetical protein
MRSATQAATKFLDADYVRKIIADLEPFGLVVCRKKANKGKIIDGRIICRQNDCFKNYFADKSFCHGRMTLNSIAIARAAKILRSFPLRSG